ncbi:MAG: helix-turn-helix transcriptional regulator, partial [Chloroflexi bacterium]
MATLRQLREKAVLTQAELARLADVTPSTVSDLEANK